MLSLRNHFTIFDVPNVAELVGENDFLRAQLNALVAETNALRDQLHESEKARFNAELDAIEIKKEQGGFESEDEENIDVSLPLKKRRKY